MDLSRLALFSFLICSLSFEKHLFNNAESWDDVKSVDGTATIKHGLLEMKAFCEANQDGEGSKKLAETVKEFNGYVKGDDRDDKMTDNSMSETNKHQLDDGIKNGNC